MVRVIKETNGIVISLGMFSDLDVARNFFVRSQSVRGSYVLRLQFRNEENKWEDVEWAKVTRL